MPSARVAARLPWPVLSCVDESQGYLRTLNLLGAIPAIFFFRPFGRAQNIMLWYMVRRPRSPAVLASLIRRGRDTLVRWEELLFRASSRSRGVDV